MIQSVTAAWVLAMMIGTQPQAPWKATYPSTAEAVAESANATPLFDGDDGPAKTVAYLVAISWFESNHNPQAVGDKGRSVCLGQIHESNFAALGVTRTELLEDVRVCVRTMSIIVRQSLRVCRAAYPRDPEAWLSWYTAGGPTCAKNEKSAHRVRKARWLFARYPVQ